jgi:hypothetical protein
MRTFGQRASRRNSAPVADSARVDLAFGGFFKFLTFDFFFSSCLSPEGFNEIPSFKLEINNTLLLTLMGVSSSLSTTLTSYTIDKHFYGNIKALNEPHSGATDCTLDSKCCALECEERKA